MEKFNILKNEIYKVGNVQKQRINITTKTIGKPLEQKDIKNIVKLINDKYLRDKKKEAKILVRGMSEIGVWTIKSYEDTIENMWDDEDDYFAGRVADTGKFQQFDQIEISLYS
jgi:predicted transcriptional regulator